MSNRLGKRDSNGLGKKEGNGVLMGSLNHCLTAEKYMHGKG